jgi:hypothetical protein
MGAVATRKSALSEISGSSDLKMIIYCPLLTLCTVLPMLTTYCSDSYLSYLSEGDLRFGRRHVVRSILACELSIALA